MQPVFHTDRSNREPPVLTVSMIGENAGFVIFWSEPVFVGNAAGSIHPDDRADIRYLYQALKFLEPEIRALARGMIPGITMDMLGSVRVPVPSLTVQRTIAERLSRLGGMVDGIAETLSREIEIRKQQLEWYRAQLFPEDPDAHFGLALPPPRSAPDEA